MMRLFVFASALLFASAASAAEIDQTKCAIEATALLPKTALLSVKRATPRQMTAIEAKQYPTGPAIWIDVEASFMGKEAKYNYVCAITSAGRIVREVGK